MTMQDDSNLPVQPPYAVDPSSGQPGYGPYATPLPDTPPTPAAPAAPETPAAPATPPPARGPGSASELRTERDNVQKQLTDLQERIKARQKVNPNDEPSRAEDTLMSSLNARMTQLTQDITAAEAKGPTTISGASPDDQFIVQTNPDGTIITGPDGTVPKNPNWNGKTPGQTTTIGNQIVRISPDGKATAAYTDQDAKNLADRQTAVSEANSRTAAAGQAATEFAQTAAVEHQQRVDAGEDAASVRADQIAKMDQLHQQWQEADGDARRAAETLRDYNTSRHQDAADQLGQDQLAQTKLWQAQQDATTRRGQDITQQTSQAQIRANLANQRLSSGTQYLGNTMDMLSRLNAAVQPGSADVANMLVPMMNLGQSFFKNLGGLETPESIIGGTNGQAAGPTTTPPGTLPTEQAASTVGPPAPLPPSTGGGASPDDWYAQWQARQAQDFAAQQAQAGINTAQPDFAAMSLNDPSRGLPAFASGGVVTRPTVAMVGERGPEAIVPLTRPGGTPAQAMLARLAQASAQAQVAAQAAAAMGHPPAAAANPMLPGSAHPGVPPLAARAQAASRPLHPDGSPLVTPQDVAALWAQRRGVQPAPGPGR